ncbi:MAG: ABC transporter ATP-binding protein [Rhodospirillaceae bacterium]|nr:ABC transporter ATP-binding protein [Rhodospirillaceae bacterium]
MTSVHDSEKPVSGLVLQVENLSVQFGGLRAVDDVSFSVAPAEIVGLIGPNGAGKTTIFNCISSVIVPTEGKILIQGQTVTPFTPERACAMGVLRTFQNVRLFGELSLRENIMMGAYSAGRCGMLSAMLRLPIHGRLERVAAERADRWMNLLGLADYADAGATSLPLGLQRVAELARAMAANPQIVLLDEPGAGLNKVEKEKLSDILRSIAAETNCALLVVDHDMGLVMGLVERLVVLDFGKLIAQGRPEAVAQNPDVIEAYLGVA